MMKTAGEYGMKVKEVGVGPVDSSIAHFGLFSDSAIEAGWPKSSPVALIGPPRKGVVPIQFLFDEDAPGGIDLANAVKKEVSFFFIELHEKDPWLYAQHHVGTFSNCYGDLHWSYWAPGNGT